MSCYSQEFTSENDDYRKSSRVADAGPADLPVSKSRGRFWGGKAAPLFTSPPLIDAVRKVYSITGAL